MEVMQYYVVVFYSDLKKHDFDIFCFILL